MKLVFYINSLNPGGAERTVSKLANALVAAEHTVQIITQTPTALDHYPLDARVQRKSIDAAEISSGVVSMIKNNTLRIWRLRKLLKRYQPNILICFLPTANVNGLIASIALPHRVIVSERNFPGAQPLPPIRKWVQKVMYKRAAALTVLTEEVASWYSAHFGIRDCRVIANGVRLPIPQATPVISPESVLPSTYPVVLSVGRLVEQKQPQVILEAFAATKTNDWHLVLIGSGPQAESITQLAKALKIDSRFHLIERVGNMQAWYDRADIYLSASKHEGFPNTLLEAMACGCAAVSFDCPTGPSELIEQGRNGELVPLDTLNPRNPCELATRLLKLMQNDTYRTQLAQQAILVQDTFSEERMLSQWVGLTEKISGQPLNSKT